MIVIHPGEYIKTAYLEPNNWSCTDLANAMDVSVSTITRLVNGTSDVSATMAWKLHYTLGRTAQSWMAMQASWDLVKAEPLVEQHDPLTNSKT